MEFKKVCEKIILIIVTLSLLITFVVSPSSNAALTLEEGEFYYAGTTKGTYTATEGIFSWLLDCLAQIASWIVGLLTMGPRMVFVGWTALIERLLTWTLETTTGVSMKGDGVDSTTDLSSISDSSSNITVQAIVYNQVPAFDINFFDIEYDPTVSGTGHTYICDKCGKECSECCDSDAITCNCDCNGKCSGCEAYLTALEVEKDVETVPPVIIQLKNLVAQWYYILRMLSMAALLIVLIAVGIKMVISTIASEKAVYKRMLIDWLVGAILVFAIHYVMWFIISMNETLVETIKDSANSINQVQLKQLYDKDSENGERTEISNEEIEISVYEEIRTRAYDPKLSVGLSGMLMYMTLVYFAIRYSLVYTKRFLTMIVLTLMAPPVGVAYALQKAISGKSSTFKAWMTEYVMNVIIQTVHALIYAIFISQALVLSLQSVAGMIVALIFMNFALKAEKLFKQIFKMSSEGSLLESAEQAGDAEKIKSNFQAMRGLYMGAKPVAGALMNTPFAKAVKGVGKIGAVGIGAGIGAGYKGIKKGLDATKGARFEKAVSKEMDENGEGAAFKRNEDGSDAETEEQYEARRAKAVESVLEKNPGFRNEDQSHLKSQKRIQELLSMGEEQLKKNAATALGELSQTKEGTKEHKKAKRKYDTAMADYGTYKQIATPSQKDIALGHIERLTDIRNHYQINSDDGIITKAGKILGGTFGTQHYDRAAGKMVSDNNGFYKQFGASKLLGFTDEDKKVFKEQVLNPIKMGFGGMTAMFVGMGTLVAHPSMGMALLAGGIVATRKTFKRPSSSQKYQGRFGFTRYSASTMQSIQRAAMARAAREIENATNDADKNMIERVKEKYPNTYTAIKADLKNDVKTSKKAGQFMQDLKVGRNAGATVATLGFVSGAGMATIVPAATVAAGGLFARKFIAKTGISSNIEAIQKHSANQARKQQIEFISDGIEIQTGIEQERFLRELEEKQKKMAERIVKEEKQAQEDYEKAIIDIYLQQGIKYDPKTGTIVPINANSNATSEKVEITEDEIEIKKEEGREEITSEELDKEIEIIISRMVEASDGHSLDMTSKKVQEVAKLELENVLISKKVLKKGEQVEQIFKRGETGLVSALKRRTQFENVKAQAADNMSTLDESQKTEIREIIMQLSDKKSNDGADKTVKAEDVFEKMKTLEEKRSIVERIEKIENPLGGNNSRPKEENKPIISISSIQNYMDNLDRARIVTPENKTTKKKEFLERRKKTRMKKIQEVLTLDQGDISMDEAINQVDAATKGNKAALSDLSISKKEASDVLELLLMRKEMETINEFAIKELDIKKGTKSFKKQLDDKGNSATEYYKENLELERLKSDNPYKSYSLEKIISTESTLINRSQNPDADIQRLLKDSLDKKRKQIDDAKEFRMKQEKKILEHEISIDNLERKTAKYAARKDHKKLEETNKELNTTKESLRKLLEGTGNLDIQLLKAERRVKELKREKEKTENALLGKGPIIDVDKFIKDNFSV